MNDACTNAMNAPGDEFPCPRPLRPTYAEWADAGLSRYVYLAKVRQQAAARRISKRGWAAAAIGLGAAALLFAACVFTGLFSMLAPSLQWDPASAPDGTSTPRHLWVRGSMPFLYQTDGEWGTQPYADGTIATHGCGPTCLAMAYVQLTGKRDMDPARMATFSESAGFVDAGVTSWRLMSEGGQSLGLRPQELPASADAIREQLRAGSPIICSVGPGDFTTTGHFIVLCGLDGDGRAIARDPNSAERSQQTWDVERILSQCHNLWAFSAA